ncbi:YncE family protein [Prevotella sp. HUN102]|uniref:YncE family protein n=1 Tax=Prevotella sp. HUN102 TaxID=1392486 RepID=UPI000AFDC40F|nr:YncE family protein [Prevotella sp. HUN102]
MDAQTAVSRGHVDVPNCRYLAFDGGYAYVSSYVGKIFEKSVLGSVYKVDTATLKIVDRCVVGYQPEEMAILNGKLYVANSGGYNPMQNMPYDKTVSVIDISTFKVTKSIDIAPNLFRLKSDKYGRLWVSSRGDYANIKSKLYLIENDVLADSVDVPIGDFAFNGDSLVYYGSDTYGSTPQYGVIDIRTNNVVNRNFLHPTAEAPPVKIPYGLIVHPITGDVYLMDATNYVSSGKLFCFDRNGKYKWNTWTGDIPGHACFLLRKKK